MSAPDSRHSQLLDSSHQPDSGLLPLPERSDTMQSGLALCQHAEGIQARLASTCCSSRVRPVESVLTCCRRFNRWCIGRGSAACRGGRGEGYQASRCGCAFTCRRTARCAEIAENYQSVSVIRCNACSRAAGRYAPSHGPGFTKWCIDEHCGQRRWVPLDTPGPRSYV